MTQLPRRVSVIIGTCDRPALLREALASIRALEGPDLAFGILVGDNGSDPERHVSWLSSAGAMRRPPRTDAPQLATWRSRSTGELWRSWTMTISGCRTTSGPTSALLDANPEYPAVVSQIVSTDGEGAL